MNVVFIGSGGHFNVLYDIVKSKKLKILGICDVKEPKTILNYNYNFITEKELNLLNPKSFFLINAIGFDPNNDSRKKKIFKI